VASDVESDVTGDESDDEAHEADEAREAREADEARESDDEADEADEADDVTRPDPVSTARQGADWRVWVARTGRTLISVGVLLLLFVAYQLWGTGIQTAQAQRRLDDEFDRLLAATTLPVTSTTLPATTMPVTTSTTVDDATPPPSTTSTTTTTSTTIPPRYAAPLPAAGEAFGRLDVPAIGIDGMIVVSGVAPADLRNGPGHFPETPVPGQLGNAAIAGHRTTHGQPFFRVDELEPGDEIIVQTLDGTFVYAVTGQRIVGPDAYAEVIPTLDPTRATLTLTSCHPRWSSAQRIVISAELVAERSDALVVARPTSGDAAADVVTTLPGSEATAPSTDAVPTTTEDAPSSTTTEPTTTEPTTTEPTTTEPTTTEPTTTGDAGGAAGAGASTFENRWFSDPAAYPHVALWGLLLTSIGLGAWAVSRRAGRNLVGALIGIVPFVVTLYFFFQNLNRLMPPNL
jgi:sortase A